MQNFDKYIDNIYLIKVI